MAEVIAQLEKQVESQKKELEYARLKIQVLEEMVVDGNATDLSSRLPVSMERSWSDDCDFQKLGHQLSQCTLLGAP
jgi:hypothetical protein